VADLAVVIGLLLLIAARPRHRPRAS
jgi:hypothetical protein